MKTSLGRKSFVLQTFLKNVSRKFSKGGKSTGYRVDGNVDCRDYCELIERRLIELNLSVDLLFLVSYVCSNLLSLVLALVV